MEKSPTKNGSKSFHRVKKVEARFSIPVDLDHAVTLAAAKARMRTREFVTIALCEKLGIDPSRYGLRSHRTGAVATPA